MSESQLFIEGAGMISPAGAGLEPLLQAAQGKLPLEIEEFVRKTADGDRVSSPTRRVPKEALTGLPRHPRIRRSSPITKFGICAGLAALADAGLEPGPEPNYDPSRLGLIFSFMNGCVSYTNRFYGEVMADPALASPLLFPETVFNAPGSHLAAYLGATGACYTIVGDAGGAVQALDTADLWLGSGMVDRCLIITLEEVDWLSSEALRLYSKNLISSEGAAAVVVGHDSARACAKISHLSGPHVFRTLGERTDAIQAAREGLQEEGATADLLVDGQRGATRIDRVEAQTWQDWQGDRLSPYIQLGDSMGAGAGLQIGTALAALRDPASKTTSAIVSCPGSNQMAFAMRLEKS